MDVIGDVIVLYVIEQASCRNGFIASPRNSIHQNVMKLMIQLIIIILEW